MTRDCCCRRVVHIAAGVGGGGEGVCGACSFCRVCSVWLRDGGRSYIYSQNDPPTAQCRPVTGMDACMRRRRLRRTALACPRLVVLGPEIPTRSDCRPDMLTPKPASTRASMQHTTVPSNHPPRGAPRGGWSASPYLLQSTGSHPSTSRASSCGSRPPRKRLSLCRACLGNLGTGGVSLQ